MILKNTQIPVQQLPKAVSVDYKQLDQAYLRVDYISTSLWFVFLFGFITLTFFFGSEEWYWWMIFPYIFIGIWALIALFLIAKNYAITGYAIRQQDLVHRTGVLFRNITTIPFNRIQHVEITQGPIAKMFGLAALKIFTAGGSGADLRIPGLRKEDAQNIKEFITKKVGIVEASSPSASDGLNEKVATQYLPFVSTQHALNDK